MEILQEKLEIDTNFPARTSWRKKRKEKKKNEILERFCPNFLLKISKTLNWRLAAADRPESESEAIVQCKTNRIRRTSDKFNFIRTHLPPSKLLTWSSQHYNYEYNAITLYAFFTFHFQNFGKKACAVKTVHFQIIDKKKLEKVKKE